MENGAGELRDVLQEESLVPPFLEDEDLICSNQEDDAGEFRKQGENGSGPQEMSPSTAQLQPPASGQVPGRRLSTLVPKTGRSRGTKINRTSAPRNHSPASAASGKRPAPVRVRPAAPCPSSCDTASNDEEGENSRDQVVILDDDNGEEEEEEMNAVAKRRLTSGVWKEMKKVKIDGVWKAKCDYCHKTLTAERNSGTNHLALHLKSCTLRKIKTRDGKTLGQSSMKLSAKDDGKVGVENYTFDQDYAREQLGNMLVLHDYPLSIVDHAGFRRFIHALQPLFKLHTINTIRNDIIDRYNKEKKEGSGIHDAGPIKNCGHH